MTWLLTFIKSYSLQITLLSLTSITLLSLYRIRCAYVSHRFTKAEPLGVNCFTFYLLERRHRTYSPYVNRYGEWLDMIANTAGICCGILAAKSITYLYPINE